VAPGGLRRACFTIVNALFASERTGQGDWSFTDEVGAMNFYASILACWVRTAVSPLLCPLLAFAPSPN